MLSGSYLNVLLPHFLHSLHGFPLFVSPGSHFQNRYTQVSLGQRGKVIWYLETSSQSLETWHTKQAGKQIGSLQVLGTYYTGTIFPIDKLQWTSCNHIFGLGTCRFLLLPVAFSISTEVITKHSVPAPYSTQQREHRAEQRQRGQRVRLRK